MGALGGGKKTGYISIIFYLFILIFYCISRPPPSFHCPSSFPLTNSTKAIALDGSDLMGESSGGLGASSSVKEGNGDARAVDFSSALSPAACARDGPSEANVGLSFLKQVQDKDHHHGEQGNAGGTVNFLLGSAGG